MAKNKKHITEKQETRLMEASLPLNYAGLAILYNILGLGAMFAKRSEQTVLLIVYLLILGNFLMMVGYLYIMRRAARWGTRSI